MSPLGNEEARACSCRKVHVTEFAPDCHYAVAILGLDEWKTDTSKCAIHGVDFVTKVQSWANNCAVYEQQHRGKDQCAAEYHRGGKEAFQRVVDALRSNGGDSHE